jgi:hypothetical protein
VVPQPKRTKPPSKTKLLQKRAKGSGVEKQRKHLTPTLQIRHGNGLPPTQQRQRAKFTKADHTIAASTTSTRIQKIEDCGLHTIHPNANLNLSSQTPAKLRLQTPLQPQSWQASSMPTMKLKNDARILA